MYDVPVEYIDGCEEYISDFLSDRDLSNFTLADKEQREKHDTKYSKELRIDEKLTAEGKTVCKRYREELTNQRSKCDAQYVNNLSTYYGDGSRLYAQGKQHYALDFFKDGGPESECTKALKKIDSSKKKAFLSWLNESVKEAPTELQRSASCQNLDVILSSRPGYLDITNSSIHNMDPVFMPEELMNANINHQWVTDQICRGFKNMMPRINVPKMKVGELKLGKVLFSTDHLFVYAIPADFDADKGLRLFSSSFINWYGNRKGERRNDTTGKFWSRKNVVLELPEYNSEQTQYRRARHLCELVLDGEQRPSAYDRNNKPDYESYDLYVELDTGRLRIFLTNRNNIIKMPQQFARDPAAIVQFRFAGVETEPELQRQIETIRSTGRAYVLAFDLVNREKLQNNGVPVDPILRKTRPFSDVETAVLSKAPFKTYENASLTTLFCKDRDCMGLCHSADFYGNTPRN